MIYDVCELVPGKNLDGGNGNDTIYLPISIQQAQNMGVAITNFEVVDLTPASFIGFSECN